MLLRIKSLIGLDRSILLILSSRFWSLLSSPLTILMTSTFLTEVEQGYYYTFNSILGASVFLEFGLAMVLAQFVSHEMAKLDWLPNTKPVGEVRALSRLASIIKLGTIWFAVSASIFLVVMTPFGLWYFGGHNESLNVAWKMPWILLVIATSLNLVMSPILASLEGAGFVSQTAFCRLCQSVMGSLCLWIGLLVHASLFSLPLMILGSTASAGYWLLKNWRGPILFLLTIPTKGNRVNYVGEILPVHFQIALSWVSGYLSFYLITPILFSQLGSAVAGRYGMSLSLILTVSAIAQAWVSSRAPAMGRLIAARKFMELEHVFRTNATRSIALQIVGSFAMIFCVFILDLTNSRYATRFLDFSSFCLLSLAWVFGHITAVLAIYLRTYKKDPLCYQSLLMGLLLVLGTYYLASKFEIIAIIGFQVCIQLLGSICAVLTYRLLKERLQA